MADYVDRNILCQAYVHIEPVGLDADAVENIRRHLDAFIATRGRFFLYETVATDVEVKDGSLKLYLTVAGALYIAIGQYGGFRDGLDYLWQDARRLSESSIAESLFLTRARHTAIIRTEARVGVVGQLKAVADELRRIRTEMSDLAPSTTAKRIGALEDQIAALMDNLRDPADEPFVANGLHEMVKEDLPSRPIPNPKRLPSPEEIAIYQQARKSPLVRLRRFAKDEST